LWFLFLRFAIFIHNILLQMNNYEYFINRIVSTHL
jgi:hypothetical protein